MLKKLLFEIRQVIITLRFSILSIFSTLFVTAILLLIYINYFYSSYSLLYTANNLMKSIADKLHTEFNQEIAKIQENNSLSIQIIKDGILKTNNLNDLIKYTADFVNKSFMVQSAYWADENGNMVRARYENNDSISTEIFNRKVYPSQQVNLYRDASGNIIKKNIIKNPNFDPHTRPWYINAKNAKKTIWTHVYLFKESDHLGITIATPIYANNNVLKGVFGIDIRLDWLSWYINQQTITPNAIIFIINQDGNVIAISKQHEQEKLTELKEIHSIPNKTLSTSFDIYKQKLHQNFNFTYQGKTYVANFEPLQQFALQGWTIGIVVPQDDFISTLKIGQILIMLISILILVLGIYLFSKLVNYIVKPIKRLTKLTQKIKEFELENEDQIKSRIKEIGMLSDGIYSMRLGLQSFRKYVPAALVRTLIETGQAAVIGGSKKNVAIFFSDINNFTTLAEMLNPNLLMEQTCEYFDAMSKILLDEYATIDKFIGDSIMAFWGAPIEVNNPCHKAAIAALKCKYCLRDLNKKWLQSGRPPFYTRIGIHTGEAIVGNVGSHERMNYTALGDTVNIANRLEKINKYYHTQILISEEVYEIIKNDFIIRYVDSIVLKGRVTSVNIYELISTITSHST